MGKYDSIISGDNKDDQPFTGEGFLLLAFGNQQLLCLIGIRLCEY